MQVYSESNECDWFPCCFAVGFKIVLSLTLRDNLQVLCEHRQRGSQRGQQWPRGGQKNCSIFPDHENCPNLQTRPSLYRSPESGIHLQAELQRAWTANSVCLHWGNILTLDLRSNIKLMCRRFWSSPRWPSCLREMSPRRLSSTPCWTRTGGRSSPWPR